MPNISNFQDQADFPSHSCCMRKRFDDFSKTVTKNIQEAKHDIRDIIASIGINIEIITDIREQIESITTCIKAIELELTNMKMTIDLKGEEACEPEISNVLIRGIPERPCEDVYEILMKLTEAIGLSRGMDIGDPYRMQTKKRDYTNPIVACFREGRKRETWLRHFRQAAAEDETGPGLCSSVLGLGFEGGRITAGDHPSPGSQSPQGTLLSKVK